MMIITMKMYFAGATTPRLHIIEIRPLIVPSCGLTKDTRKGCMIILTEPEIPDGTGKFEINMMIAFNFGM